MAEGRGQPSVKRAQKLIVNEEGEFAYYKVENEADYAAALEAFKAQNDWTYTFES